RGRIAYLHMVRGKADPLVKQMWNRYQSLVDPTFVRPPRAPAWHERLGAAMWVLECEEEMIQGTAFDVRGVGTLTCSHVLGTATKAFKRDAISDKRSIEVLYRCATRDLALIRVPETRPSA